ncbi:hypothetical protein [Bacillus sp. B-jedd]|nr:hypothetical protein [Bacillus sp. B-jedd]CEG29725.1 hypothetical protein BN1002_04685 [Bacillus sp. B-jedd]
MFNLFKKAKKGSSCCNVKIEEVKEIKEDEQDCCVNLEKKDCCSEDTNK